MKNEPSGIWRFGVKLPNALTVLVLSVICCNAHRSQASTTIELGPRAGILQFPIEQERLA
jgi:hypothetical protein